MIAIISGIQFYLWIVTYANQRERHDRLAANDGAGKSTFGGIDPAQNQKAIKEIEVGMRLSIRRYGYFYRLLLWSFHIGLGSYAVSTLSLLLRPPADARPAEHWSIATIPCCAAAACKLPQPHVLLIEETSGQTWILTPDSSHSAVWLRLAVDSATSAKVTPVHPPR